METKHIDIKEFREFGYLQELNRNFLHPLGLALEVQIHEDGTETLGGIWDYREDPEGLRYEGIDMREKALRVSHERQRMGRTRLEALGYLIQPATDRKATSE